MEWKEGKLGEDRQQSSDIQYGRPSSPKKKDKKRDRREQYQPNQADTNYYYIRKKEKRHPIFFSQIGSNKTAISGLSRFVISALKRRKRNRARQLDRDGEKRKKERKTG
jgi:hypothetical protein